MTALFPKPSVPVSVAIVLYHSNLTLLEATLKSLAASVSPLSAAVPLTIVDQSQDGNYSEAARALCAAALGESAVDLRFIVHDQNKGYGAGHNRALMELVGDIHIILNPDVELARDALQVARQRLQSHPEVTLLAPRGRNNQGQEEFLAKRYPSLGVLLLRAFGGRGLKRRFYQRLADYELRDLSTEPGLQDVPLVSGCCMVVRGEALRQVHGFDEHFFMYFEDYDLSLRLARLGRVVREPAMLITHHGGRAAGKGLRHIALFAGGAIRFFSRWGWRFV